MGKGTLNKIWLEAVRTAAANGELRCVRTGDGPDDFLIKKEWMDEWLARYHNDRVRDHALRYQIRRPSKGTRAQ